MYRLVWLYIVECLLPCLSMLVLGVLGWWLVCCLLGYWVFLMYQQLCWIFELWNIGYHLWTLCMCLWLLRLVQCMGCLCSLRWLWWLLRLVVDSYFLGIVSLVGYLWSRIRLLMVQYFRYYDEWNSSLCCYLMVDDVGKLFVWFGLGRQCCLGLCWLV